MKTFSTVLLATLAYVTNAQMPSGGVGYVDVYDIVNSNPTLKSQQYEVNYECVECQFNGGNYCNYWSDGSNGRQGSIGRSCFTGNFTTTCTQ